MEILGPRDPGRPQTNRAGDSNGKNLRSSRASGGEGSIDRLEPGDSVLIDRAVRQIQQQFERSATDVSARREELLARSLDPEAIHRAARSLIRSGIVGVDELA